MLIRRRNQSTGSLDKCRPRRTRSPGLPASFRLSATKRCGAPQERQEPNTATGKRPQNPESKHRGAGIPPCARTGSIRRKRNGEEENQRRSQRRSPEFPAVAASVRFLAMRAGGRSETRKRLPLSVPYVLPFLIAARNRAPRFPWGMLVRGGAARAVSGGAGRGRGTRTTRQPPTWLTP